MRQKTRRIAVAALVAAALGGSEAAAQVGPLPDLDADLAFLDGLPEGEAPAAWLRVPFEIWALHSDVRRVGVQCRIGSGVGSVAAGRAEWTPAPASGDLSGSFDVPLYLSSHREPSELLGAPYICTLRLSTDDGTSDRAPRGTVCSPRRTETPVTSSPPHCEARRDRPATVWGDFEHIGVSGVMPTG